MCTLLELDVAAGIRDVGDTCCEDGTVLFSTSDTDGSVHMPALDAHLQGEACYKSSPSALPPSTGPHCNAAPSSDFSSASMLFDAVCSEQLSAPTGHQQVPNLQPMTPAGPTYALTSKRNGFSVPAALRWDVQQLSSHSSVAATNLNTTVHLSPRRLRHVSSGLSGNSTMTPARSGYKTATASRPNQYQPYDFPTFPASLVSGSSRKRKAPADTSPESCQGDVCSFHIGGVPVPTLLPDLGRPGMQPHNVQPLQRVPKQMPNSQPYAGSVITESTTPFKRQRLSRSSGSWGSSGSARSHLSYMIPTPGQACDPCGLAEVEAQGKSQYASSVSPQLYYQGQLPSPLQAQGSSAAVEDPTGLHPHHAAPQTHFQAYPHASLHSTTHLPPHASPQEAMASPQAPHQTPPQAPVTNQGAAFQAGQVVWARCRGHPWWPAMVTPSVPISLYLVCIEGHANSVT